jgi:phenylpropionate dioxygenase-like ring-hydroxylating dioxygenase large terminal subunit
VGGPEFLTPVALRSGSVPVRAYVDAEYFAAERERVFRTCWLNLARAEELPEPGSYLVRDLEMLDTQVLLVRGDDGVIRAFHNLCVHRGNRLAIERCGKARGFQCQFHGWTYDARGALRELPDREQFPHLDPAGLSLKALACEVWEGFVFVCAQPRETLAEYLGEVATAFRGFPFGQMRLAAHYHAEVRANWKLVADALQEAYHAPTLHRRTVADAVMTPQNPYCHLASVRLHGRHHALSVFGNLEHRPTPMEEIAFRYSTTPVYPAPSAPSDAQAPGVNPQREAAWMFDINVIFPNFHLDPAGTWYGTYHLWPLAGDRTRWEFRIYMYPPKNAGDLVAQEYTRVLGRHVQREDLSTVEATHAMLKSGALDHIHLSAQELPLLHSYEVVDAHVRGDWT